MPPSVSIVIANFNGKHLLDDCLMSLNGQTFSDFEIIIIDNGSSDGSVEFIKNNFPKVRLIENKENFGFAEANNQGIEISKGKYVVTLNNDTIVDRNWLKELVIVAEKNKNTGMVASKIFLGKDGKIIDSVGLNIALDGMTKQRGGLEIDRGQYEKEEEILFPSACAALYKMDMLKEIGFFDGNFFAYCEDSDLGLRGRMAGWGAVYAPRAFVRHLYSQTAGKYSPFKLYFIERNHTWLAIKNFPKGLLILFPLITFYRFFLQFLSVLIRKGMGSESLKDNSFFVFLKNIFLAYFDASRKILFYIKERKKIKMKKKISNKNFYSLMKKFRISFINIVFKK